MGTLRLYAIAIDDVRDIFGADESEAAGLRSIAAQHFGRPAPRQGLLGKLGPLFARPADAPVIAPDSPTQQDCDRLLAAEHVPPDRLPASWRLLEVWLAGKAWSSHSTSIDEHNLNAVEFDLGRAEVPAKYGVHALAARDLGIAIRAAPSMAVGYAPGHQVMATAAAWQHALPELLPETQSWVGDLLGWLEHFPEWTDSADAQGRPRPDLVSVWTA